MPSRTAFDRTTTPDFTTPGAPADGSARIGRIELDGRWSSLRGMLGGYLAAIAVRSIGPTPDTVVRTLSTSFLRPTRVGAAELHVTTRRAGRTIGTHDVSVVQDGREVSVTRITTMKETAGTPWDHAAIPDLPPREECSPFVAPEAIIHFQQAITCLDPSRLPMSRSERADVGGYVRPLEPGPIDAAWLAMILDWFPPSPFTRLDPPDGGVSVDYTVHIHRTLESLGDDDWLQATFRADISAGGLALEHGVIAAPDGALLAESFHTRWTG